MTDLKTRESLLEALRNASQHAITEDELRKQRVSFIMGSISEGSGMTRARVEELLDKQEGRKVS